MFTRNYSFFIAVLLLTSTTESYAMRAIRPLARVAGVTGLRPRVIAPAFTRRSFTSRTSRTFANPIRSTALVPTSVGHSLSSQKEQSLCSAFARMTSTGGVTRNIRTASKTSASDGASLESTADESKAAQKVIVDFIEESLSDQNYFSELSREHQKAIKNSLKVLQKCSDALFARDFVKALAQALFYDGSYLPKSPIGYKYLCPASQRIIDILVAFKKIKNPEIDDYGACKVAILAQVSRFGADQFSSNGHEYAWSSW